MNSKLLFLLACIPTRIVLAILPQKIPENYLPIFGILLGIISISFLYLYFSNKRLNAFEAGGKTWWHSIRLVHGMLFATAAIYCFQKSKLASLPLALDVLLGLSAFIYFHSKNDK